MVAKKFTAERAPSIQQLLVPGDFSARDPQRLTGFLDTLSCGFQQFSRNVARIAPAACVSIFRDLSDKSVCIGELLSKYRVQKFDYEGSRCPIVMKDDFAVAGFDLPITHLK
jgi:hypothetical protein